ncbi:hypothetical protein GYH30_012062 [Glycine max]|nr:hypothetical protein GYH30_012062 [Glycine max]
MLMRRKEERHVGLLAEKDAEEGSPLWCCQRRSHQGRATQSEEDHEAVTSLSTISPLFTST